MWLLFEHLCYWFCASYQRIFIRGPLPLSLSFYLRVFFLLIACLSSGHFYPRIFQSMSTFLVLFCVLERWMLVVCWRSIPTHRYTHTTHLFCSEHIQCRWLVVMPSLFSLPFACFFLGVLWFSARPMLVFSRDMSTSTSSSTLSSWQWWSCDCVCRLRKRQMSAWNVQILSSAWTSCWTIESRQSAISCSSCCSSFLQSSSRYAIFTINYSTNSSYDIEQ